MIKVLNTKTAYTDPFVEVILEDISINNKVIPNFSIVKKRNIVMIVPVTDKKEILIINEYKFGSKKNMWTLPAGGLKKNEDPIDCAKRELEEETGYSAKQYKLLGEVYDYPSKDRHSVYIVRANNITHNKKQELEVTEVLTHKLISQKDLMTMIVNNEFQITSALSAVLLAIQQT